MSQTTPTTTAGLLDPAELSEGFEAKRKASAIKGAFFSEFIDMFDIYLPTVVLSPVLFLFHPAGLAPATEAMLASLVFITTLLGRPVGALVFGLVADRTGRRVASIYSVSGFGILTTLIAFLPSYGSIGIASYWLLILLRFLDGVCLGGGYTGAIPLAFESAEKNQRGAVGGYIMSGFPAAYVAINLLAMLMFFIAPLHGADSPYAQWGWRVPFVIGGLLAGWLAVYYIRHVPESELWRAEVKQAKAKVPLSDLVFGRSARSLLQVFVMMTGFWLTQNIIAIFVPATLLLHVLHLSGFELTLTLLICYTILIFSYKAVGRLGQRIGRKRFFLIAGPVIATVGAGLMAVLVSVPMPLPATIAVVCLMSVIVTSPWGMIITYINERFVTDVRATGFGVAFSLSVIIPSFYAFFMDALSGVMSFNMTAVALLCVGGLLGCIGAAMGPETRDVDF